ncbi:MAG: hypothetical protein LBU33_02600, partial [Endomicrobium sp.]|nr:hypothetical protein [Endomicrobium sp.]
RLLVFVSEFITRIVWELIDCCICKMFRAYSDLYFSPEISIWISSAVELATAPNIGEAGVNDGIRRL